MTDKELKDKEFGRQKSGGSGGPPLPQIPKIPEEVKKKFPDLKPFWDAYDLAWDKFHRGERTITS